MARCEEGYRCEVCGEDVESIAESDLYLRFVVGMVDPELLHTAPERHIRCNPPLAQFIVHEQFAPVVVEGEFDKRLLDADFVRGREQLLSQGWQRLQEVVARQLPLLEYPLPELHEPPGEMRRLPTETQPAEWKSP